jgi:hypothetical protein
VIIRRRHTANFTTIGNKLFDDDRLEADEVGILAYLLSRPHDWEVRRPALRRRWHIGSAGMKRILNNLMRTGWCQAHKTRLTNGTFRVVYEIRDEPGPQLTEAEIREALSLVSSEADPDDAEADTTESNTDHSPQPKPPHSQPVVDDQGVATEGWCNNILNTKHQESESTKAGGIIARIIGKWPSEHILSRIAAEAALAYLTNIKLQACEQGVEPYLADCKVKNRKVCDLTTFVREMRWERFVGKQAQTAKTLFRVKTAQWFRWREYKLAIGQSISFMERYAANNPNGMWTEPSEWPPALPKNEATGPPLSPDGVDEQALKEFSELAK